MKYTVAIGLLIGIMGFVARADTIRYGVPDQPWNARWGNHQAT